MHASHRNLIIAAIGDDSQHLSWITGSEARSFDLALVYYGDRPNAFRGEADYYFAQPGFKFPLLADALEHLGDRLDQYDYIWAPDDDLAASTEHLNRLFKIASNFQLPISQPAIAAGDVSYQVLRQQPQILLRYTGFVEVMCPLFSRDALRLVRPTFRESLSGWGLDWAWTCLVDKRRMAVIDAVGVNHTRSLGAGEAYRRFAERGITPADECRKLMHKYGLRGPRTHVRRRQLKYGTLRCEAVDLAGRPIVVGPPWWKRFGRAA
ncbi:MAG: DUF707 domain-containing protein [Pirellulales bacterium]